MEEETVKSIVREGNQIRRGWKKINKQLQYYLDYQLWMVTKKISLMSCCTSYSRLQDETSKQFKRGFKKLTKIEKANFYLMNVKYVDGLQNSKKYLSGKQKDIIGSKRKVVKLKIEDDKWFKKFTEVEAQILTQQKIIQIQGISQVDLHMYILRESRNKKLHHCLVLQSIQASSLSKVIRLCVDSEKIESQIKQCWKEAQFDNIKQMIDELCISNKGLKQIKTTDTANSVEVKQFEPLKMDKQTILMEADVEKRERFNKLSIKDQFFQQRSLNTQMFEDFYLSQIDNSIQFFSLTGSLNTNEQRIADEYEGQQLNYNQNNNIDERNSFLNHKYRQTPMTKAQPVLFRRPKGHIIFGDQWTVRKNGDLAFTNQQKIKMHSSVFKMIIKKLGSDLLAGKGFNISLPAMIFGSNTYLQKMLDGYVYGPIFLQRAAKLKDPVERIRNIVCFMLGVTVTFIQADKPFNPVLGETYQAFIDGCPGYAEQISHHPPISSVLFYGRGYRVSGHFEPIVQIGLNKCIGINKGIHIIQFQDGTKVKCQNAHAIMHSLAFGQRKLEYFKKSDIIDQTSRIVCEVYWGKQNDPRPEAKLHDFVKAKIMKIKSGVDLDNLKSIKKKDIEEQFEDMYGRWTGQIYSKGNLFFDIQKDQPHLIQHYHPCLPSDSRFRKDLNEIKKKNFEQAQIEKDELQQTQRYFRKLRKKFHPDH